MSPVTQTGTTPATDGRRERVLASASVAFAARGYHDTSVEEISSESGVDSRALAEMFPDKYSIFREVALRAVRVILHSADVSVGTDARQARAALANIIGAVARTSIDNRGGGGFYRAESRYLRPDDMELLRADIRELRMRVVRPLLVARPDLSESDAEMLAAAALSTIASITVHPTNLPDQKIATLLTLSAMRLLESEPATVADAEPPTQVTPLFWQSDKSERGMILAAGIALFYRRGYRAVTMDDIASRAGVTVDRVKHYFANTSTLLSDACLSGYDSVEADTERALTSSLIPRDVLVALSHAYVWHYFEDPELMTVYLTEAKNVDEEHRGEMQRLLEYSISRWVRTLCELRPELSRSEASFLAFAGLSIVSDLGRLVKWDNDNTIKAKIEKCVLVAIANFR